MLRRDLLRSLLAMPLPGRLRHGMPRLFSRADSQETDAAALYRSAFGWTKGLRPVDSDRLRNAATIAVDGPDIDALIRHARSALKSLHKAAAMRRCDWGVEPMSANDLGKGRLDVSGVQLIRRRKARGHARGRGSTVSVAFFRWPDSRVAAGAREHLRALHHELCHGYQSKNSGWSGVVIYDDVVPGGDTNGGVLPFVLGTYL